MAEVQAFEEECAQLESMLQQQQQRQQYGRCSHSRQGHASHNSQSVRGSNAEAQYAPGASFHAAHGDDVDGLLEHAMHLRDTIAELARLVPEDADLRSCCDESQAPSNLPAGSEPLLRCAGKTRVPLQDLLHDEHGRRCWQPAQLTDTTSLASIRAVTQAAPTVTATSQSDVSKSKPKPSLSAAHSADDSGQRFGVPEKAESATEMAHVDMLQSDGQAPACGTASLAAQQDSRPAAASKQEDHGDCDTDTEDAHAVLTIQQLQGIPVSAASLAAMHAGQAPHLWLAWRMPGAVERKTWCNLTSLAEQQMLHEPGRGFELPQASLQVSSKVCMLSPV